MRSSGVLRIRLCLRRLRGYSALVVAVLLVTGFVFALPASAPAVSFTLITIDVPGAFFTQAFGINDSGQIVGFFSNEIGNHGFLYDLGNREVGCAR